MGLNLPQRCPKPNENGLPMNLEQHIENHFGLSDVRYEPLNTPTNDVLAVTTPTGRFALKLYHLQRTAAEVQWEVDLILSLIRKGAPVAKPVRGTHGYVEPF